MTRFSIQAFWLLAIVMPLSMVECEERKVAPSYCLRFKLNCESDAKKKHVCCTYPLPEGDEVEGSHFDPAGSGDGISGVKIRPIQLPQREKSDGPDNSDSETAKRPTGFGSNNGGLSNPNNRNTPKSSTTTSAPTPSPKRPRICIRLVVNCNSSPDHRCCKFEDEEKEVDEETTSGAKADEEVDLEQESPPEDDQK